MQNKIEQIGDNIIDEMKYDNGVVYLSISGSARLVGVNESSIRRAVQNGHSMPKLLAQCGVEVRHLNIGEDGIPDYVHALITKYYAYYAGRYCTELAKQADLFFSAVGVREWGKKQLGVEDKPKSDIPSYPELLRQHANLIEEYQKLEQEKQQSQLLSTQLLKLNGKTTKESKEYQKCVKLIKDNSDKLGLNTDSENLSDQINEMAENLLQFKSNIYTLLEDVTTEKECYSLVSITKWCVANNKQVPVGVKRWLSRYAKAISEYCQIDFMVKGQFVNGQKYDASEFHPKVIKFVKDSHDANYKQKKIVETFAKLINEIEAEQLELLEA